ncbi:MAG: hypothetical protein AAFZ07_20175 [Actinomycetota bacterium]
MKKLLSECIRAGRVMNAVAAGTTDQNGTGVDLSADGGYDGVLFIGVFGALTATQVTQLHAEVSDDDGSSDGYSDLADSQTDALGDDDDNDLVLLDVFQPPKKWVRPVVERGTANAVIDGVIALLYRGRAPITSHLGTVAVTGTAVQKAEGTI